MGYGCGNCGWDYERGRGCEVVSGLVEVRQLRKSKQDEVVNSVLGCEV